MDRTWLGILQSPCLDHCLKVRHWNMSWAVWRFDNLKFSDSVNYSMNSIDNIDFHFPSYFPTFVFVDGQPTLSGWPRLTATCGKHPWNGPSKGATGHRKLQGVPCCAGGFWRLCFPHLSVQRFYLSCPFLVLLTRPPDLNCKRWIAAKCSLQSGPRQTLTASATVDRSVPRWTQTATSGSKYSLRDLNHKESTKI